MLPMSKYKKSHALLTRPVVENAHGLNASFIFYQSFNILIVCINLQVGSTLRYQIDLPPQLIYFWKIISPSVMDFFVFGLLKSLIFQCPPSI